MRSIHTILDQTDHKHLKEIVLVDDYSDIEDLHTNVRIAIKELNGKIQTEQEMLETNNIDMDNVIMDYINDDGPKHVERTTVKSSSHLFIKLLKTDKREGLIRARLFGAEHSNGHVSSYLLLF